MSKLMGALLVLTAGGMGWQLWRREQRGRQRLLWELAEILDRMAMEIRMEQPPLPELFRRAAEHTSPVAATLFGGTADALLTGADLTDAWETTVAALPLSEQEKRTLDSLGKAWRGPEQSVCKGILLVRDTLREHFDELEKQRPDTEKRTAALCFSAAALLLILLI